MHYADRVSCILEWTGWVFADGMTNTVNVLVGMPLLLQGLCVIDFHNRAFAEKA